MTTARSLRRGSPLRAGIAIPPPADDGPGARNADQRSAIIGENSETHRPIDGRDNSGRRGA